MPIIIIAIAIFTIALGAVVAWANPERLLNRAFCTAAIIQAIWLGCVYAMILAGSRGNLDEVAFWLRLNAAFSAFFPLTLWLTKELVSVPKDHKRLLMNCIPWILAGVLLASLAYTPSFVFRGTNPQRYERGPGYYLYELLALTIYCILVTETFRKMRSLSGMRRIETQFLAMNLVIAGLIGTLLTAVGTYLDSSALKRLSIAAFFCAYAASAWAISTHRIFEFRQVFTSISQRISVIIISGVGVASATWFLDIFLPQYIALFISTLFFGALAFLLDRKSREWLDLNRMRHFARFRQTFIEVAKREASPDELCLRFSTLLSAEHGTLHAMLLIDKGVGVPESALEISKSRLGYSALCQMGWATPESLERRRPDPALADLQDFLSENNLGVIVTSPHGSESPALVVALGRKPNDWPFTYPEVQRLQNIAELMDSILARSRLAMQAAMQVKLEHMAMMSRGLAHDLSNLITPISSFLICTDGRFPVGTTEAEVHFAARRSIRVMGEYVREALFFSERLSPNFERVDPGALFRAVQDLTTAQATEQGVGISISSDYHDTFQGDTILLHRTLVNLVNNALDASKTGQVIELSATAGPLGRVLIKVSDCGSGVPPENIARIFDPYFTTKQFGAEVRGFGLGLTICQKIVHLHHGTISVSSRPNRGTTFTIDLPISPAPNGTRMTQTRVAPQPREIAIARPQPILT